MKIDIVTNILAKALRAISGLKTDMLISVTGDIATLTKTDGDTTLKTNLTGYSYENGSAMLPHEIAEIIKKLKDDELTITDEEIQIKNRVIRYEQKPLMKIPLEPLWEEAFRTTEKELHRMLEVKYAIGTDTTRPILCGVYFNKNETCALDGYRLSVRSGDYESDKSFVVNANTIELLDNILDIKLNREIVVYYSEEKVKFTIGSEVEVIGNILEGEFINYKSIIPDEPNIISKVNLNALKEELNLLSGIKTNILKLSFTENELNFSTDQCKEEYDKVGSEARTSELQTIAHKEYVEKHKMWVQKQEKAAKNTKVFKTKCPEEKIIKPQKVYRLIPLAKITSKVGCTTKFSFNGREAFNIACNYKYLNESLKTYTNTDEIQFRMSSCVSPIVITNDGENLELVLPIRIKEDYTY